MPKIYRDPREGRTLVLCPPGIGSFLRATPALKVLVDALGPDRVSVFATTPAVAGVARASGMFQRVYSWSPERDGWLKAAALLAEIRDDRFTHSLTLFPASHWTFSLFQFVGGAAFRAGFRYPHERLADLVQHHSLPLALTHDVQQNLRLVEMFLQDEFVNPVAPFLPVAPQAPPHMPGTPFFACHPGASMERGRFDKRLSPDAFAALIRNVHRETGWKCVLVGGPEEQAVRAAVAMDCREALADAVETKTLAGTAGLLEGARFFLGNDSGPLHLAAAVGTRCAAYFGPSDETLSGPYGHEDEVSDPLNPQPRHLILRRDGSRPIRTLETIGRTVRLPRADVRARWDLDLARAWPRLRTWITSL